MRASNAVVAALVPALVSEAGQALRAWLDHRRKRAAEKPLEERLAEVERRLAELEKELETCPK